MSEKTTSSSSAHPTNPWQQIVEEQISRIGSFYDDVARFEHQGFDRINAQVDEMAKLTKESFAYANQLSAEWRRIALEATRRAADLMSTRV